MSFNSKNVLLLNTFYLSILAIKLYLVLRPGSWVAHCIDTAPCSVHSAKAAACLQLCKFNNRAQLRLTRQNSHDYSHLILSLDHMNAWSIAVKMASGFHISRCSNSTDSKCAIFSVWRVWVHMNSVGRYSRSSTGFQWAEDLPVNLRPPSVSHGDSP